MIIVSGYVEVNPSASFSTNPTCSGSSVSPTLQNTNKTNFSFGYYDYTKNNSDGQRCVNNNMTTRADLLYHNDNLQDVEGQYEKNRYEVGSKKSLYKSFQLTGSNNFTNKYTDRFLLDNNNTDKYLYVGETGSFLSRFGSVGNKNETNRYYGNMQFKDISYFYGENFSIYTSSFNNGEYYADTYMSQSDVGINYFNGDPYFTASWVRNNDSRTGYYLRIKSNNNPNSDNDRGKSTVGSFGYNQDSNGRYISSSWWFSNSSSFYNDTVNPTFYRFVNRQLYLRTIHRINYPTGSSITPGILYADGFEIGIKLYMYLSGYKNYCFPTIKYCSDGLIRIANVTGSFLAQSTSENRIKYYYSSIMLPNGSLLSYDTGSVVTTDMLINLDKKSFRFYSNNIYCGEYNIAYNFSNANFFGYSGQVFGFSGFALSPCLFEPCSLSSSVDLFGVYAIDHRGYNPLDIGGTSDGHENLYWDKTEYKNYGEFLSVKSYTSGQTITYTDETGARHYIDNSGGEDSAVEINYNKLNKIRDFYLDRYIVKMENTGNVFNLPGYNI